MNGDHKVSHGSPEAGPEGPALRTSTPPETVAKAGFDWHSGVCSLVAGVAIGAAALAVVLPFARALNSARPETPPAVVQQQLPQRQLDLGTQAVSADVRQLAEAVVRRGDNGSRPFVLIDKREAQLLVFEPAGRLLGATPILLGYAPGDDSVAGIGQRPIDQVKPEERTTPAGRFIAEPGRNTRGEEIIWVDYDAAVSMHRVRLTDPKERRLERLASPNAKDRRISYGCINLPVAFFDSTLWPTMRKGGVVYVLPEFKQMAQTFPGLLDAATRQARLEPLT